MRGGERDPPVRAAPHCSAQPDSLPAAAAKAERRGAGAERRGRCVGGAERGAPAAQAAERSRTSNEGSGARLLLVSSNQLPLIAVGAESELMFKGAARRPPPKRSFLSPPCYFIFLLFLSFSRARSEPSDPAGRETMGRDGETRGALQAPPLARKSQRHGHFAPQQRRRGPFTKSE